MWNESVIVGVIFIYIYDLEVTYCHIHNLKVL